MIAFRRALVASVGVLALAAACTSISVPTIPPIPSFPQFSIPPIVLPSGLPTIPPVSSADASSGVCALISASEVSSIMGGTATVTGSESDTCTYTMASNFQSIVVSVSNDTLDTARILLGSSAKEVTIAGNQGLSGVFIGQPAVYVQKGDRQMQVLGILTGSDDATIAKIVQIAETAASRWQ